MAFLISKKINLAILLFFVCGFSQEFSLDLQSIQQSKEKNERETKAEWGASGLNLILPGTGYFYLGQKKTAVSFLTTDIVLWSAFIYTNATSRSRFNSSIGYARVYAHTKSTRSYNDNYWAHIANKYFLETKDFNAAMQNNRDFENTYTDEKDQWKWESEEHRDRYAEMRQTATNLKTASTLVLGTLALNRVVSFITARVSTKKYNDRILTAPVIAPTVDLENKTSGISVSFGF